MKRTPTFIASRTPRQRLGIVLGVLGVSILGAFAYHSQSTPYGNTCQIHKTPFSHTLCTTPNKTGTLSLVWKSAQDTPFLTFKQLLQEQPNAVVAMNAGMYNAKYAPIGYTVIDGKEIRSLNLKEGVGNFHLMPNGVFWQDKDGFHISESKALDRLLQQGKRPTLATQSGPMLVIDGKIHPKFDPDSTSKKIRNGIGTCKNNQIALVISDEPVNFYQFAQLFKDHLGCQNALFLDGGTASALYSKELNRSDNKNMGVMIVLSDKVN